MEFWNKLDKKPCIILTFSSNLSLESKMMEVQSDIQTIEETREDLDNFGYNLMDCSSCLLVKMGEKANYSGMLYIGYDLDRF